MYKRDSKQCNEVFANSKYPVINFMCVSVMTSVLFAVLIVSIPNFCLHWPLTEIIRSLFQSLLKIY